jgi:predicted permease
MMSAVSFLRRSPRPGFRATRWFDESRLDLVLGVRLLRRYPGLSIAGGIAMAVAIGFGTATFAFFYSYLYPVLPLPSGDRVIALENWDTELNNEARQAAYDLGIWRRELTTVEEIGAFRNVGRNLIVTGGPVVPIVVAEMTAAGFGAAHVAPLLGRPLVASDERADAEPVLVIGHDVWRSRFAADPSVVGRHVRLGSVVHTIVGVMPERFAFPMNHSYWAPLRIETGRDGPGDGPAIFVFGRLARGATVAQAQAELTAIGQRSAAAHPRTHARLRPQVLPYTYPLVDIQDVSVGQVAVMQGTISLLLVVVALNVAILVYARTATRQGEIAIRTALGASRARIIGQLFAEALVLCALAAAAGLLLARIGLTQGHAIMGAEIGRMPFWMDGGIPAAALFYVLGLTVVAALLAGVLPALQATRQRLEATLRASASSGMRLGATWTALIVAQVAIAVAGLPVAVATGWREVRQATAAPAFTAEEYLGVRVGAADPQPPAGVDAAAHRRQLLARVARLQSDLGAKMEAEPTVVDVTLAAALPGGEPRARLEVAEAASIEGHLVTVNRVAVDFFAAFDAQLLTGRTLSAADGDAVVVNQTLARRVFADGQALGRRIRYVAQDQPGRWLEIVGVVSDLYTNDLSPEMTDAAVFHALNPASDQASLILRVRGGDPAGLAERVRQVAASMDPDMRVSPMPLAQIYRQDKLALRLVAAVLGAIGLSVLLLSAGGIYTLMSFAVSRRRKEIGIRAALGADSRRLLGSIFARAAVQVSIGVMSGAALVWLLDAASDGDLLGGRPLVLLPAIALLMLATGLAAALGPARRTLRIQPTEALRDE